MVSERRPAFAILERSVAFVALLQLDVVAVDVVAVIVESYPPSRRAAGARR